MSETATIKILKGERQTTTAYMHHGQDICKKNIHVFAWHWQGQTKKREGQLPSQWPGDKSAWQH